MTAAATEPPAKRQRVTDGETTTATSVDDDHAAAEEARMSALMPPIPGTPPVAPEEERHDHRAEKQKWWTARLGMKQPELVYCSADYALWPEEAKQLFRATKTNTDEKHASRFIRNWFREHEGMPSRVPTIPRSAYWLYVCEQKTAIFTATGAFDNKRDGKKIGAAWKKLTDAERKPYEDKIASLRAEREAQQAWRNKKLKEWETSRQRTTKVVEP